MKTIIATEIRPNYFKGQLLQAEDFLAEQGFHIQSRLRHNQRLHRWGIVSGFAVSHKGEENIIVVHPGIAIDRSGHEIELTDAVEIVMTNSVPNGVLKVSLAYEEVDPLQAGGSERNRRESCTVIDVDLDSEVLDELTLAIIRLDGQGRIGKNGLDFSRTKYASTVPPGSITHHDLHESLRKGWLRLPFRPIPLVNPLEGEEGIPPGFRVGATEAQTPHIDTGETERGAAGTMAIPLPPNIRHVRRFRVAGVLNKGGMTIKLITGGWDPVEKVHIHRDILVKEITSAPFDETFAIEGKNSALDPECHTLSIWIWGRQKTSVSLIAVELEY